MTGGKHSEVGRCCFFFFLKKKLHLIALLYLFFKNQQISPRFCNYSDLLLLNDITPDVINDKELQL